VLEDSALKIKSLEEALERKDQVINSLQAHIRALQEKVDLANKNSEIYKKMLDITGRWNRKKNT